MSKVIGRWMLSQSSLIHEISIAHFVPSHDGEAFCNGAHLLVDLTRSKNWRHCYRCTIALIREGFAFPNFANVDDIDNPTQNTDELIGEMRHIIQTGVLSESW